MVIKMNRENVDNSFLQIRELKEKVRSLVSEVDLNRENSKFKHENSLIISLSSDEGEDEFVDCTEIELGNETNWLTGDSSGSQSVKEICQYVYSDVDDDRPDITDICQRLEVSSYSEPNIFSSHKASIDSRTFTRPKKYSPRPALASVINAGDDGRPKLVRRLTTTISPSPNIITKLEELSKVNNRPVSGNYGEANWQDGSKDGLAEVRNSPAKTKRQSLPASLYDRLQELKKANSSFKMPKVVEPADVIPNGNNPDYGCGALLEEAKKVKAALDVDAKSLMSSSRLSEFFRNTQDYYSDDNESFISLDEVSGFCDRLTMSTDQCTYSSIVREMEQSEICLFHRTLNDEKVIDRRLTFGGVEIPIGESRSRHVDQTQLIDVENDLNRTYEIDENEQEEKANRTFENINIESKHNIMNTTYDANRRSGLTNVINNELKKDNYNNNDNRMATTLEGNNMLNNTYDKLNGTLTQKELNALRSEKYSTKVFDSSFRKANTEKQKSPTRKSNGKKDSDQSEDDCMSTTSDNSYRSVESNPEGKAMEELKERAIQQGKRFSSTPLTEQRSKMNFEYISPIRMEMGDGESQKTYSNPSSRGQSPRRSIAPNNQEGAQKYRMPSIKQPLKVPQRELKLKPALVRPTQNFKRPLSYARTSSEPSVPQKVESSQSAGSVAAIRPSGPTAVPSLTNMRPSTRASGIPRPPTRLKQPQIRVNYSKK